MLLHAQLPMCDDAAREKSPGSCPRPRPVPLHQEPGSERSSSRTRGAHLASDGSSPQLPTGAVVLLYAPPCSCPATPPRTEKVQGAAPGRPQCRCTKNHGQRGAATAPEGRTWPLTAPAPSCPRGLSCCSTPRFARAQRRHRAREKNMELPQAAPSAAAPRTRARDCLLYTSPSPRDVEESRMPSSA